MYRIYRKLITHVQKCVRSDQKTWSEEQNGMLAYVHNCFVVQATLDLVKFLGSRVCFTKLKNFTISNIITEKNGIGQQKNFTKSRNFTI